MINRPRRNFAIMTVQTHAIEISTGGNADILKITERVIGVVSASELTSGIITLFSPSATSALTTIEFEQGCVQDFQRLFDEIAGQTRQYTHNDLQGDGNGHSHVRAALLGPSLTIPFVDGRLTLGTWQEIIFIDFDNRARQRNLVAQVMGE